VEINHGGDETPRTIPRHHPIADARSDADVDAVAFRTAGDALRAHFDDAPIAIAEVDSVSHRVIYANSAALALSQLDAGRVIGRPLNEVLADGPAERIVSMLVEMERTGQPLRSVEVEYSTRQRERRHWSVSAWPVHDDTSDSPKVLLQAEDISDQVRERIERIAMSDELRRINERLVLAALREENLTHQAEAANDAKTAFLATMSHELRTPLTAIIGYEELLSDGITGPVTQEQVLQLGRIRDSAMHLLALIEQILTLSRLAAKNEVAEVETMSLASLVRSVSMLVAPLAAEKRLVFRTEMPPEDVLFESDPLKVKAIVVNLLSNAVRFTDRGEIALIARVEDGELVIEVSDTGIGIDRAYLDEIFEPFFQIEQRSTRRVGGSGLGLSVSQRLARLLDGDITVRSTKGEGSCFTVRIPLGIRPRSHDT
jgi:PAS domain S-box-containing protein